MKAPLLAAVLLPSIALLNSTASATLLYVDYEGYVHRLDDYPGYSIGDAFMGSLVIDTSQAPPDPNVMGGYGRPASQYTVPSINFVTGFEHRGDVAGEPYFDYVRSSPEQYDIVDAQGCRNLAPGDCEAHASQIVFSIGIPGDAERADPYGIVQSFVLSEPEDPEINPGMYARLSAYVEGVSQTLGVQLTRFAITPTPGHYEHQFTCSR